MLEGRLDRVDDGSWALLGRLGRGPLFAAISNAVEEIEESCCDWADDDYANEDADVSEEVARWQLQSLQQRGNEFVAHVYAEVDVFLPEQDFPSVSSVPMTVHLHLDEQHWLGDWCEIAAQAGDPWA